MILERFVKTSVKLQDISFHLPVAVKLLKTLREYVNLVKNNFINIDKWNYIFLRLFLKNAMLIKIG